MKADQTRRAFRIIVAENSHYQDPEHEYEIDGADTAAGAVAKCRDLVDQCLQSLAGPGRTADQIIAEYRLYGEDPYILPPTGKVVPFSAWTYAEGRAADFARPQEAD